MKAITYPFRALASYWRRHRRRQEWQHKRREFVYLDEVSVTSLVAARHGSIPESYTDNLTISATSEVGSDLGGPEGKGVPKVGLSTRNTTSRQSSQEVVRRAVVQGTFRDLRIGDNDLRLSVEDQTARRKPKPRTTADEIRADLDRLQKARHAVRVDDLIRGDVIEVAVRLSPERSYQLTAALTSMIDLIEGRAAMFGITDDVVTQVQHLLEMLTRLLVDLVPIEATVISHRHVTIDGQRWLLSVDAIKPRSALREASDEVTLAGVTELPLYWKDVRRVLFDNSEYIVYARVSKAAMQSNWSPIKLADVLERAIPGVGAEMSRLPHLISLAQRTTTGAPATPVGEVIRDQALEPFGRDLAASASISINDSDLTEAAMSGAALIKTESDAHDEGMMRAAFEQVVVAIEAQDMSGTSRIDRELVRRLRELHQTIAQLKMSAQTVTSLGPDHAAAPVRQLLLLEAEFIAIYW